MEKQTQIIFPLLSVFIRVHPWLMVF